MPTVQEWFDKWSKTYDEYLPHFPVYKNIVEIIIENANIRKGAKILDIGLGTGNIALSIFSRVPCKITGVDISDEMMNIAKVKAKQMGAEIELIRSSADKMELSGTFDLATAAFSIHHLKEKEKLEAFRRIFKPLKKGGRFILADLTLAVDGDITSEERLKGIVEKWKYELQYALKYIGPEAVEMSLNGMKKVYYKDGEYPETPEKWKSLLKQAGFNLVKHEKPDEKIGYQVFVCEK